jgi:hypothetical protein
MTNAVHVAVPVRSVVREQTLCPAIEKVTTRPAMGRPVTVLVSRAENLTIGPRCLAGAATIVVAALPTVKSFAAAV